MGQTRILIPMTDISREDVLKEFAQDIAALNGFMFSVRTQELLDLAKGSLDLGDYDYSLKLTGLVKSALSLLTPVSPAYSSRDLGSEFVLRSHPAFIRYVAPYFRPNGSEVFAALGAAPDITAHLLETKVDAGAFGCDTPPFNFISLVRVGALSELEVGLDRLAGLIDEVYPAANSLRGDSRAVADAKLDRVRRVLFEISGEVYARQGADMALSSVIDDRLHDAIMQAISKNARHFKPEVFIGLAMLGLNRTALALHATFNLSALSTEALGHLRLNSCEDKLTAIVYASSQSIPSDLSHLAGVLEYDTSELKAAIKASGLVRSIGKAGLSIASMCSFYVASESYKSSDDPKIDLLLAACVKQFIRCKGNTSAYDDGPLFEDDSLLARELLQLANVPTRFQVAHPLIAKNASRIAIDEFNI